MDYVNNEKTIDSMEHEVKQQLRLVDGKFMRGDVEWAPEIGNREQIELLQRFEREYPQRVKVANELGIECKISVKNIRYDAVCEFTCVCCHAVNELDDLGFADSLDDLDDSIDAFEGSIVICKRCKREYVINGVLAKLHTNHLTRKHK